MHDLKGLTTQEAKELLLRYGINNVESERPISFLNRFLSQFLNPLLYILLFALAVDLAAWLTEGATDWPTESIAIATILVLNGWLGAYQEFKADEAITKTKKLGATQALVLRDGKLQRVAGESVVPGDVLRIEAGDRIAADAEVVHSKSLSTDESLLTGESLPIEKQEGEEIPAGALVVRGMCYARVVRTGASSAIGKMAASLERIGQEQTPLEKQLRSFAQQIAIVVAVLGAVLVLGGIYAEGLNRLGHVFMFSVALAVAAIPEGLAAVLTVAFSIGVQRMAQRKALVRKLNAVETLGSVSLIATDKTGTLTENRMTVQEIDSPDPERAFLAMVIANDAEDDAVFGDSVDVAFKDFARKSGKNLKEISKIHLRKAARPFDSAYKFMSVTVHDGRRDVTYLKGAPEVLLRRSRLSKHKRLMWEEKAKSYAKQGMRVLALAWAPGSNDERVTFLGLAAMWDPPRQEVPAAINAARSAGIRVVMVTGDHPDTSAHIAGSVGIDNSSVVTGKHVAVASDAELSEHLSSTSIFARVLPEHKLRLVDGFRKMGHVVAVTGDGVNDALAVKRADVGIAMGQRGSDVTREVADIVLLDDNFTSIVAAIAEGRSIYENILKFIGFFLSTDLALTLLVVGGLAASYFFDIKDAQGSILLPLTAVQLLWINVVADGPAALALTLDRNPGLMRLPPRRAGASLLSQDMLSFIVLSGLTKAVIGLALFVLLPSTGISLAETQTAVFLYEAIAQLVFAYPVRHLHVQPLRNGWLHFAVLGGIALQLCIIAFEPTRHFLGLNGLSLQSLAIIAAGLAVSWSVAELVSAIQRQKTRKAPQIVFAAASSK